jgi:putative ABC transport system permease protein
VSDIRPVRLAPRDIVTLGLLGIRTRKLRAVLSALGICLGIATLVVVTAVPAAGNKALMRELSALGTNMLQAQPQTMQNERQKVPLPRDAVARVERIGPVTDVSAVANTNAQVQRSDFVGKDDYTGLSVLAARPDLLGVINARMRTGTFLKGSAQAYPSAVLGSVAADRLGLRRPPTDGPAAQVHIAGRWFTVTGVLARTPLSPDIDRSVLVGWEAARTTLKFDGHPTVLYVKAREDALEDVREVLAPTLSPEVPGLVQVSRPSDALAAKRATQSTLSALFLALAAVALLVGGIGVANTMVVGVLERRREIGLRRALGASRRQIRGQFVTESAVLSGLGGAAGTVVGALAATGYALQQDWPPVIPVPAVAGGFLGALLIGVLAGVYPAVRASLLPPTTALSAG